MDLNTLYPVGVKNVVFMCSSRKPEGLHIRHFVGGNKTVDVSLEEECQRLQLNEEACKELVRRVAESMLSDWAAPDVHQFCYGDMWDAGLMAVRTHLPEDTELLKRMLHAAIIYLGGNAKRLYSLINAILPEPKESSTLQDVINYLLEAGCTVEAIQESWKKMLEFRIKNNFLNICIVEYWKGLVLQGQPLEFPTIAMMMLKKNFENILVHGRRNKNRFGNRMPGFASAWYMDEILGFLFGQASHETWKELELVETIESYFVTCLAKGWVGTAAYMMRRFGRNFDIWSEYRGDSNKDEDEKAEEALQCLARVAVAEAEGTKNYGIASALAEYVGEIEQADALREKARALKQAIRLDFAFYLDTKDEYE
ncbi:hypothetical protein HZA86_00890 [Candidatus Uhrbacteria bacterium]|nr:hypothetical protein [Candidatus Uhrbacteria bacterium]